MATSSHEVAAEPEVLFGLADVLLVAATADRSFITMARRRHTPEQTVRKLREGDPLLGEGADVAEVARHLEVSEQT